MEKNAVIYEFEFELLMVYVRTLKISSMSSGYEEGVHNIKRQPLIDCIWCWSQWKQGRKHVNTSTASISQTHTTGSSLHAVIRIAHAQYARGQTPDPSTPNAVLYKVGGREIRHFQYRRGVASAAHASYLRVLIFVAFCDLWCKVVLDTSSSHHVRNSGHLHNQVCV